MNSYTAPSQNNKSYLTQEQRTNSITIHVTNNIQENVSPKCCNKRGNSVFLKAQFVIAYSPYNVTVQQLNLKCKQHQNMPARHHL